MPGLKTNYLLALGELTVVDVELRHSSTTEVGSFLHMHKAMLALFPLNVLLYSRCPLVHQVPATDAAI